MGEVTETVGPQGLHAVNLVSPLRTGGGRETPVAVADLLQSVGDLRPDIERVIDPPALRGPDILGDEQRHHQGLEHAPAPARDDPCATIIVRALEDLDPVVVAGRTAGRLLLRPQVLGQGPEHPVV